MIARETEYGGARYVNLTANQKLAAPDAGGPTFIRTTQNADLRALILPYCQPTAADVSKVNLQRNTGFVFLIENTHGTHTLQIKFADSTNFATVSRNKFARVYLENAASILGTWRLQIL